MDTNKKSLELGVEVLKAGDKTKARYYFLRAIREEPNNENAWGWLSATAETDEERIHCFRQVVRINPDNSAAKKKLLDLEKSQSLINVVQDPKALPRSKVSPQHNSSNQGMLFLGLSSVILFLIFAIIYLVLKPVKQDNTQTLVQQNEQPTIQTNYQEQALPCPPCTVLVNSWRFTILEIHSDPGSDRSRQNIILIGNMYNEGTKKDLFLPTFLLVLKDSAGRVYEDDLNATFAAEQKYGTEYFGGGGSNPGAYTYVAYGFDVPASEKIFEIAPGEQVANWGGNFQFMVP